MWSTKIHACFRTSRYTHASRAVMHACMYTKYTRTETSTKFTRTKAFTQHSAETSLHALEIWPVQNQSLQLPAPFKAAVVLQIALLQAALPWNHSVAGSSPLESLCCRQLSLGIHEKNTHAKSNCTMHACIQINEELCRDACINAPCCSAIHAYIHYAKQPYMHACTKLNAHMHKTTAHVHACTTLQQHTCLHAQC
jgi:hypothetical protein